MPKLHVRGPQADYLTEIIQKFFETEFGISVECVKHHPSLPQGGDKLGPELFAFFIISLSPVILGLSELAWRSELAQKADRLLSLINDETNDTNAVLIEKQDGDLIPLATLSRDEILDFFESFVKR